MLTIEKLYEIVPEAKKSKLDIALLVELMNEYFNSLLTNVDRRASFIAQTAHESGKFTTIRENLNYSEKGLLNTFGKYFTPEQAAEYARQPEKIANRVYANRMGNGSEESGDGWRYRGRGFIQLTGKSNYQQFCKDEGIDLLNSVVYLESVEGALHSAIWFWNKNQLNKFADVCDIKGQTKVINGGYNGLSERIHLYDKAKLILNS